MINTISSTTFYSFGKQGISFGDAPDADPYSELFAALFSVPVVVPPTPIAFPDVSQNQKFDDAAAVNPIDLSTVLTETDRTPMPEFMPKLGEVPSLDLPPTKNERWADVIAPQAATNETVKNVPAVPLDLFDQPHQDILELGPDIPKLVSQTIVPVGDTLSALPEAGKVNTDLTPVAPQPRIFPKEPPLPIQPVIGAKDDSEVFYPHDLPTDVSRLNVGAPMVTYFAPNTFPIAGPTDLPKVFKDVSSVVKADNSLRTTFQDDALPDSIIVEQIKQSFLSDSSKPFDQPRPELLKAAREFDVSDQASGLSFNTSLKAAAKERKFVDALPNENKLSEKIFDQVEPRLMELVALNHSGPEKRVLKMRLTPADLGTVEITVEKNAAGKISAHFQTDSPETRQILNQSLIQLRDSLERSGMQVGDLDTSCTSFSSNGNDARGERRQEFGTAEDQPGGITNFDGISQKEDDKQDRLVNLRA